MSPIGGVVGGRLNGVVGVLEPAFRVQGVGEDAPLFQPYLFRVIQEQDAGAELTLTIEFQSRAGIPEQVLERPIEEGFDQQGITVK